MSVILAVNEALLSETVPTDEEAQAIFEKFVDFFEKSDNFFEYSTDLGIDPEVDDFVAAEEDGEENTKIWKVMNENKMIPTHMLQSTMSASS